MTLRITVGAVSGEVELIYPLSTPGCQAQPPGTYTPQAIPVSPPWALAGLVLLMLATALSGLYRRRNYGAG
jgi:hypothetical protein